MSPRRPRKRPVEPAPDRRTALGFEDLLDPEQRAFFQRELVIRELALESSGKIQWPREGQVDEDRLAEWRARPGVIDATTYEGMVLVIFNAHVQIPEGCNIQRPNDTYPHFGGTYNPETDVCSVDISETWDYIHEVYKADWNQQFARHELRHGLVTHEDRRVTQRSGVPSERNIHGELIDPEALRQLAYVDELHGQFFDGLEGEVGGLKSLDTAFYSIVATGTHLEVATQLPGQQANVREIFSILQSCIFAQRMAEKSDQPDLLRRVTGFSVAAGVLLGTERSLDAVHEKLNHLWNRFLSDDTLKHAMQSFLLTYTPTPYVNDAPQLTEELRTMWS